jgi:hypothetical protein
VGSMRVWVR